jgi:hypothetical protein
MERKRRLALIFATVGIALGVGHIIQRNPDAGAQAAATQPTNVDFVSAGPDAALRPVTAPKVTASALGGTGPVIADLSAPARPFTPQPDLAIPPRPLATTADDPAISLATTDDLVIPTAPEPVSTGPATPAVPQVTADIPGASASSDAVPSPVAPAATEAPVVQEAPVVEAACPVTMKIAAAPQAMIGISILAPCAPAARVVIEHEGLAITGKTSATGSLFLSIPAMALEADVTAYVGDADMVSSSLRIPAMATLRRFGVQWQDKDAFQMHAFEDGADYGDAGHVSADDPHAPLTGTPSTGGFLTLLGDDTVVLPMMAAIYTFPTSGTTNTDVLIEAAVTEATCGREMLGETLMTLAGEAYATELTLAMPDCEGVGDILVLKNLMTDLTIAAAD